VNKKEYEKLEAYYAVAKSLKTQIENLERLLRGVRSRSRDGCKSFKIWVYRSKGLRFDRGIDATIPEYTFREAIVPALATFLQGLKEDYKALPQFNTKEAK
jgi:hypothetical protein